MQIHNDGPLDIAVGKSRHQANWKNKRSTWSKILERIEVTHRTAETHAEYMASSKDRQDEVKDVGGFVGGYLTGGKRKPANVKHRQLLTLDLDSATADSWDSFSLLYDCAAAVYSTHKHTPERPRLRLLIPLDRPVTPEEYEAIGRMVAGDVGIEAFDNTGFQPFRLMYWPSTSKDGQYFFAYQDGEWLSADKVLARYTDWTDASEWPMSVKVDKVISRLKKKQLDPLEKPGLVGAWCKQYDIHQVIAEHLADVYQQVDGTDRYTYLQGSTAGGLITYEDKFAYSHHGTDPISGQLCNSFDLVRIHLFGGLDEEAKDGTPGGKMPSFVAMQDKVRQDPAVKKVLSKQIYQDAVKDFSGDQPDLPDGDDDWLEKMDMNKKGTGYEPTANNIELVLNNDPALKGAIGFNAFEQRAVLLRDLPWKKLAEKTRYMQDNDDVEIRKHFDKIYGIVSPSKISDGISSTIYRNSFHPVMQYLDPLEWDGMSRLDTLLIDYLGADDTLYVRTVTRKIFVAAVARIYQPGIKFDHMLITVGMEGIGKSSVVKIMGSPWFSDSFNFHMIGTNKAEEAVQGAWLIEAPELYGMSKADVEAGKSFLTKGEDRLRMAYGKRVEYFPRQCVFFGSTNKPKPLNDAPGNRRFWPVMVNIKKATKDLFNDLPLCRDQIWSEAVGLYLAGETLYLDKDMELIARKQQGKATDVDNREGQILEYVDMPVPAGWQEWTTAKRKLWLSEDPDIREEATHIRNQICGPEIACELFNMLPKDLSPHNTKYIHDALHKLEHFEPSPGNRLFKNYGYQRCYIRTGLAVHTSYTEL